MPKPSKRTQKAERGFGIDGKPYYFYVLRANENFGLVVFVLSEIEDASWPPDAMGTPLLTAAAYGKTSPMLDDAGQQAFFRNHDVPLAAWRNAFEKYVRIRYSAVSSYLKGDPPRHGSKPGCWHRHGASER